MGGMPFYLEKGMIFSVFEDYVNSCRENLENALVDLRAGLPIAELGGLKPDVLNNTEVPSMVDLAARIDHLNRHWFGMTKDGAGPWTKRQSYDTPLTELNGAPVYWHNYAGDVEAIMRETMIRACEIALGLEHGEALNKARRNPSWPIELLWKCGQNWFEGWMTWTLDRTDQTGKHGHVTVLICTPTSGAPIRRSAIAPDGNRAANSAEYSVNPSTTADRGMIVVTNEQHNPVVALTETDEYPPIREQGDLGFPIKLFWQATGAVVAVSPSEPDGGVLSAGRSWQ